ncbi:MAG: ABC transporter permease, partial [bacterium]
LAGLVMLPSLTMVANFTGILGSYLVGVLLLGVDSGIFLSKIETFVELRDIWGSLIKAAIFGVVLTHVGCYKGYFTENGAEGVVRATTEAVSFSAVIILYSDYIITSFWQR